MLWGLFLGEVWDILLRAVCRFPKALGKAVSSRLGPGAAASLLEGTGALVGSPLLRDCSLPECPSEQTSWMELGGRSISQNLTSPVRPASPFLTSRLHSVTVPARLADETV